MNFSMPADRSTDAHRRLPRLGYFVLGSLLLHALVVVLWQGKPPPGPLGQSTFQITLLARHGDTSGKAGAKTGQQENNAVQRSNKNSESSATQSAFDEPTGERPLPITVLAASVQSAFPAAPDVRQSGTRPRADVKKTRNKATEEAKSRLTKRHVAAARGGISATPGSASSGQDQLNIAARFRRVRAALQEALLPRFDYPSVARRRGWQGRGYALGVGEVKLTGMVRPDRKMLTYKVDFTKAIQTRRLTMGVANGIVEADGEVIYQVTDMKVALSEN